nr:MAG TPA: large terminase protein [Caudoviricetes sp.]
MAKTISETRTTLTREELSNLSRVSSDVFFFSLFCYVIHPVRGKVRFDLYPFQKSALYNFIAQRFNIILKFRQAGITELISMYCLWLAMYHPNKKINIISIKDTTAKKVLKKIKFMYKNLPWYLQTPIINGRAGEYGSASMIEFDNGSFIESIPTSSEAGRSESLSLLVIDEAAVVRWAAQIWAAAFPTLSTGGAAIVNSCITGNTKIITDKGLIKVRDLCPKQFGAVDLSLVSNLRVLTHKGEWKRIVASVNKGKLETWKIQTEYGTILKCTPNHKLYTLNGWMSVRDIIEKGEQVILYKTGLSELQNPPKIMWPDKEIWKPIKGYEDSYQISNRGEVKFFRGGKWIKKNLRPDSFGYIRVTLHSGRGKSKHFRVADLVISHFTNLKVGKNQVIDHIDCVPAHNWVTNLQVISRKENTQRASLYSYGLKLGTRVGKGFTDLDSLATVIKGIETGEIKKLGINKFIETKETFKDMNLKSARAYISKILSGKRGNQVKLSKLRLVRKFKTIIYDITVEDHHSYMTYNFNKKRNGQSEYNFINKNTPYGVGNFYHSTWVDAIAGGNPFNPIRLYWQMHPERDINWYNQMSSALGAKRTAQEIDGDFLSSGNTVFDLADIKAIEDCLSDYPVIKKRFNGQYRQFCEPESDKEYFIGADVSTGRASDYSSFTCMDKLGEEQVVYKGRMAVGAYAKLLGDTGKLFNWAIIAPESNDVGLSVTSKLQDEGYPNLYYYQKMLKKKGKSRPEMDKSPGWLTTQKNRSVIIENLEEDIRLDHVIIKDPFFVQEAYTFIYDGLGRPVAMGKHRANNSAVDVDLEGDVYADDDIFGKAICNHIRKGKTNVIVQPR